MILFKHISKYILLVILLFNIGCSSDSPNEDQQPEETSIEDFENFEKDPKFREHIEKVVIAINKVNNYDKVLELLEESELNDSQQAKLTLELGYQNTEEMNVFYDQLNEEWEKLDQRFDLINQNHSVVDDIIIDALSTLMYNISFKTLKTRKQPANKHDDCIRELCTPSFLRDLKPMDRAQLVCDNIDTSTESGQRDRDQCTRKVRQRFSALFRRADFDWACCMYYLCGRDRPTVVGFPPFDYSKCPQVPIS